MVFAAGLGTRLKPFTLDHPKALVPVGGVPMLERVLLGLKSQGFDEIVVNVHHFAAQVVDFLRGKDNFGMNITISDESDKLLDTGGGVLHARTFLEGNSPVVLYNSDILSNVDLSEMLRQHISSNADVTLLATPRQTSRYLCFEKGSGRLAGWINKSTGETRPPGFFPDADFLELAFGGVHVISQNVFGYLEQYSMEPKFSLTPFYIDSCRFLDVRAYTPLGNDFAWFDVGKPDTLASAEKFITENHL